MNDQQTEWTKRKTDQLMDYLAKEIIATLTELEFDKSFIQNTTHTLIGKNRFEILLWCNNNLEPRCKSALAQHLGVEEDSLNIAISIVVEIESRAHKIMPE
jgi:hypothetical protein